MRRLLTIPGLEIAAWSVCAGLAGYIIVSAALEGRWGRVIFFAVLSLALGWAISEGRLRR